MAEDLGAVLDAPVLDGVDDQQVDDAAVVDDAAGGDAAAAAAALEVEAKQDERLISQKWRDLKESNPELYKEYKSLFFGKRDQDGQLKDFDLAGTKTFLEEHGGRESLTTALGEMQATKAELDGINAAVANGDRGLVDQMATNSPEGFAKLAPAVAEKWAQVDPEGWDHAMSGVFNATIQQSGVPMHLERMGMQLEQMKYAMESTPGLLQNPALVAVYNQLFQQLSTLKGWSGSFGEKAGKALARTEGATKIDAREQGLNDRESAMFNTDLGRTVDSFRDPLIAKELATFISRRPEDADAKQMAIANVKQQVIERMSADANFQKQLNQLCARKDKDGAMRLIKSRETTAILEIAPKVGRTIFGNPGAARVAGVKTPAEKAAAAETARKAAARTAPKADVDPRDAVLARAFAR
jgi:hypothetical protein